MPSVAPAACVSAALISGCGGGGQQRLAQHLENVSILSSTAPLGERLVQQSEIASASDANAVQTFLRLWSLLQFQSWDQAEQLFEPGLRAAIGPSLLAQGLAADLLVWQDTKPHILTAHATGSKAVITFLVHGESGTVAPASVSFERAGREWLVSYFSLLDGALQRWVQTREQARIEPLATKPSAEAVRQGFRAGALQSGYLERLRHSHTTGTP